MTTPPVMPAITHVAVTVTDLARSEAWYTRLLGVSPVLDEDTGPFHHIVYLVGNTLLGIHGFPSLASTEPFDERCDELLFGRRVSRRQQQPPHRWPLESRAAVRCSPRAPHAAPPVPRSHQRRTFGSSDLRDGSVTRSRDRRRDKIDETSKKRRVDVAFTPVLEVSVVDDAASVASCSSC